MEVLIKALQFILSLSILVILHELGHYIFAKMFKIRVEKFYLFFNPGFSIFKVKIGETEYGMGWIPFGGYVKIAGMVDESMDTDQMSQPAKPYEFRSKPAWQRLLVMIGGVLMNVITAIVIYICMTYSYGATYIDNKDVKNGYAFSELGHEMGFKDGDKIISIDEISYNGQDYRKIIEAIVITSPEHVKVEREGEIVKVQMDDKFIPRLLKLKTPFMSLRVPMKVDGVEKGSIAETEGIMVGDSLIAINGIKMTYHDEYKKFFKENSFKDVFVNLIRHKGDAVELVELKVSLDDSGIIGVVTNTAEAIKNNYTFTDKNYTILESIPEGFRRTKAMITNYIDQMKLVFTPSTEAYKSVGSVISMGSIFPSQWNWEIFWSLTALYSVVLAVMNILPIPALDGGHVMFLLYEVVTRRTPNEKFMEYAQMTGMFILLALILLALGNDIYKLFT